MFTCKHCGYKTMYSGLIVYCPKCKSPNPNLQQCPNCGENKLDTLQEYCHRCGFDYKSLQGDNMEVF